MTHGAPLPRCWACGSEFLTEEETVPVNRKGEVAGVLICEDCGRVQRHLSVGRGVL